MATFIRRTAVGALVLFGLLVGQNAAEAQFSFGWTRYGYNPSNPFVAQQQYLANLQATRLSIASGAAAPAWLPYIAPYVAPRVYPPYYAYSSYGYTAPVYNPYLYSGYSNYYGVSPYYYTNPYGSYYYSGYNPYSSIYAP